MYGETPHSRQLSILELTEEGKDKHYGMPGSRHVYQFILLLMVNLLIQIHRIPGERTEEGTS